MTERNLKKELCYTCYYDRRCDNDTETIDYESLFALLEEILDRIEKLEQRDG